jgi:hypothetical protein
MDSPLVACELAGARICLCGLRVFAAACPAENVSAAGRVLSYRSSYAIRADAPHRCPRHRSHT